MKISARATFRSTALAAACWTAAVVPSGSAAARFVPPDVYQPDAAPPGKPVHLALIGDSLSTNFHVSGTLRMILMCRRAERAGENWFLDPAPSKTGIKSLAERLGETLRVRAVNRSTVGSYVDGAFPDARHPVVMRVMRSLSFRGQVALLLREKEFPDVLLVWVGHPNLDWVRGFEKSGRGDLPAYLASVADRMAGTYEVELRRLVRRAQKKETPTLIVAYGLVDMRSGSRSRAKMAAFKAADPKRYPYFFQASDIFLGLKPANSGPTSDLRDLVNERLQRVVESLAVVGKVRLEYSDALARVDISDPALAHPSDAWHASPAGHNAWAEAAQQDLLPRLMRRGLPVGDDQERDRIPKSVKQHVAQGEDRREKQKAAKKQPARAYSQQVQRP